MQTCDDCGREFKNRSGLSGHKQLTHRLESGSQSADSSATERFNERLTDRSQRLTERSAEALEQLISERLERIEAALDGALERYMDPAQYAQEIAERLDNIMTQRHPAGMCDNKECHLCTAQRQAAQLGLLDIIEKCLPGTKDTLANCEMRSRPIFLAG